jgi:spermidine/putrescine transport system permease protein
MRLNALRFAGFAIAGFLILPLAVVVAFAFSDSDVLKLPIEGWSLRWFRALGDNEGFHSAMTNSATISLAAGALATLTGTLAAFGIAALDGRGRQLGVLLTAPFLAPPLLLALIFLTWFSFLGVRLGLHTTILAHIVTLQPIATLIILARLANFNWAIIDSARDLGASSWRIAIDIVLPIFAPTILGSAMLVMALSLDDFVITFFTIGGESTVPTYVWGMMRKGVDPSMNAAVVVVLALATALGASALRRVGRYL